MFSVWLLPISILSWLLWWIFNKFYEKTGINFFKGVSLAVGLVSAFSLVGFIVLGAIESFIRGISGPW